MPSVKISEHTDRPDIINLLKEKLGIKFRVFQELIHSDKRGRSQADIFIFNAEKIDIDLSRGKLSWTSNDAVISIIETKIQREENLENHEPQLFKYLNKFNCNIGFITNYKSIASYIRAPDPGEFDKEVYQNAILENLVDFITDIIGRISHISIQRSPEVIMDYLEKSIEDLNVYTARISGDEWETILRFSDASEIEEKKNELSKNELEDREQFLQRSASYIAIAQILFYITFRQFRIDHNINNNPNLPPLSTANGIPTQLQEILVEVPNNNLNFKAIFGKNKEVFSHLDDDAAHVLNNIIFLLEGVSAEFVIKYDLIGQIFQRLLPYETRKKFAAYYTLNHAAELLCLLAINEQNETVYDPACGSGTLLVNAYRRKRELGLNQHKRLLEQIRGSDISDVATMMSTLNLAIQDPSKWTNHVNLFPYDAIDLSWGMTRFQYHTIDSPNGKIEIEADLAYQQFKPVDVLLANPPFTRGSRLSENQREKLRNLYFVKEYKYKPNFKAVNLYAFFLFIAPHLIKKESGKIAFVLPQGAINSLVMVDVWKILFKIGFGLKIIIEASDADKSFSDSEDHEIMVILEKGYDDNVKFVKLIGKLEEKKIKSIVNEIKNIDVPYKKTKDYIAQVKKQREIQESTSMEWNINPSQIISLIYQKFIPLNREVLSADKRDLYDRDLKNVLTIITENASRPVNYWFIPNKFWEIIDIKNNKIIIQATSSNTAVNKNNQKIKLPYNAFVPAIARSLKQYKNYPPIIHKSNVINFFLLDESRDDIKKYFKWGVKAHEEGLFGSSHSTYTPVINSGGIVKRINFTNSKTLALRFKEPKMGTQIIRFGFNSENDLFSDLFFSYLSSSIFLLDALEKSRKRSAEFVLINQVDFYVIYRFPDLLSISKKKEMTQDLLTTSELLYGLKSLDELDLLSKQIREARINPDSPRRKLDESWFTALNIPINFLDVLYQEIEEKMVDFLSK